ncbi:tetratricopeptide repeat protein [Polyangium sp. 15x6]|uniref:tetratricopeptide repeat protein n=1 Tax=Polyangium sp. 15x6 TaxID=3042687 RepID=UPI00249B91BD|nr:tetratricopeptide repeat protein [Polyangium sp. 15x6]MDI3283698.1 tetratricopeptide repeat protein [Polyangium sp. 15x6]
MAVDRDKVLRAAQKFVEGKRWDKAIAEFQKLIAEDPKDVRVLLKIGDCHIKIEQYAEAIETYEIVARLYIEQKPPEPLKSIRVYRQILEIIDKRAPKLLERFGYVLPRLAELYTQLGLTSDAAAAYDDIANRLHKANKDREAIEPLKKVVDLDPHNPVPRLRLAEAYSRIKDTPASIAQLGQAAEVLVKMGRRDDALKVLDRLLTIKADGRYAKVAAKMYLERAGQTDAMTALAKLQISFKENPKDLETLSLLAKAFDKLGQAPKATEVLKEAARLAKEAKKNDEFNALVDALLARAPNDDAVRQLAAQRPAPPRKQVEEESVIDIQEEEVDEIDYVEDLPPESSIPLQPSHHDDEALRARHILQRAEAARSQYDYANAIVILRDGVTMVPSSHELRSRLVDVLKEAGDEEGAIRQMLIFAQRLSVEGDVRRAAELLDEVLLMDPAQPEAIQMLRALGYQVEAPQPQPVYPPQNGHPYPPQPGQLAALDDPFTGVQAQQHHGYAQQPQYPPQPVYPPQQPAPTRSQTGHVLDEDVLEQIDFYANQGMLDDARAMLDEQLALLPNHPLLLYKHAELEQMGRPSYVPELPGGGSGILTKKSEYPADNDFETIQNMINELEFAPEAAAAPPEFPGVNVDTIFQQFKAGVQAQISDADAATHYDLGVAYREMGMYTDAIGEFEVAARDPARECVCRSVIGMIHLQLGNVDAAIDAFLRGLEARQKTREQELALAYELADAYEARKNPEQALYYFKRAGQIDSNYRDPRGGVQDRIRRLEPIPGPAKQAKAAGAELLGDDFDLAFDDLLSTSKGKMP